MKLAPLFPIFSCDTAADLVPLGPGDMPVSFCLRVAILRKYALSDYLRETPAGRDGRVCFDFVL